MSTTNSQNTAEPEYVLGTGNDELERLGLQHRIWADASVGAWKRAGIGPGSSVLDLGCGPGYASFDLAQLVGSQGKIIGLDESKAFVDFVNEQASFRNLPQLKAVIGDAQNLSADIFENKKFDAVYCRWVLCWLQNPEKTLKSVRQVLKPGAPFIIHDYFNWKTMTCAPRSQAMTKIVNAAVESFEDRFGDVDIMAKLPKMLRESGYEIKNFSVDQRVARGGGIDSTVYWPLTWWRIYMPKLVKLGKISEDDQRQVLQDLALLESDPDRFYFCPPVFEIIAKT